MTAPAGHELLPPFARIVNTDGSLSVFVGTCACGLDLYGERLWHVFVKHDEHLGHVKAQSMRSHPSRKDGAA